MILKNVRLKGERPDFEVQLKYATLIADLSDNLKMVSSSSPKLSKIDIKKLDDKIKLVTLTKKSIDQEYQIVSFDKDYSSASVLWLPIKTYYLIYHLLCIIDCLMTGKISSLTAGHNYCVNNFTKMLASSYIQFNKPLLSSFYDEKILSFNSQSGEILKRGVSDDVVYQLIMKKIANDKIDDYKRTNGLSGRRAKDKIKIIAFKKKMSVSIFDFFYLMRLRMNYRNFDFVDNIPSSDTKEYFEKYYISADNFYKCFLRYIKDLIKLCP